MKTHLFFACSIVVSAQITLTPVGRYDAGGLARADIAAYDPDTRRIFALNGALLRVDALDISDPAAPALAFTIPLSGLPNGVAVRDGVVAVAVENTPRQQPGRVQFFNTDGLPLNSVEVGAVPDMLAFSPNGRWLLVVNEGEPNSYGMPDSVDPEGSVSIIDMSGGAGNLTQADVRTARFTDSIPVRNAESIRVYGPGASLAQDLEPEYVTVSHNSKTAWVTLQENNALALLDIDEGAFTDLVGLGFKDHSAAGNALDPSDRDGGIRINNWPVLGLYQPDEIDSYRVHGQTYLVMANEGDSRDYPGFNEERRVGDAAYLLDPAAFPEAGALKMPANLGRLTVTRSSGDTDGDGDFDQIHVFGARSFSIRTTSGELVFDSGEAFERITAEAVPGIFNSNGTLDTFDTRSDNKGPEPEGVVVAKIFGDHYAFLGLERTGGVMVWDISDPYQPVFVQYVNTAPADLAPEGLIFIPAGDSPNGRALLVVSSEVSGTTTIFEIRRR